MKILIGTLKLDQYHLTYSTFPSEIINVCLETVFCKN